MHQAQWSPERPLPPPVSLASQSHHEKPPQVTCTSRGNPGFPASTRKSPRETFFNTSRGQIPLPWLGSNDAVPLATRMETRLPWRPTRGSLTSPSYLVRDRTLGPPLENNPEIPPSSRAEGLRLLHGLETTTNTSRPWRKPWSRLKSSLNLSAPKGRLYCPHQTRASLSPSLTMNLSPAARAVCLPVVTTRGPRWVI